ncbi:MAG: DUF2062 domain-containing protein, partial [Merismopedia sp. SIO2A8]|nr:DUF2062 domain-containing protein [Merismopedia sp. SIO2A8]
MSYNTLSRRPRSPRPHRTSWRRRGRYIYLRLIRQRGSSGSIARGLAAGVFAGCFPLLGLQTIIGVAIAALIRGNKLMAAAGTWISNPLTYIPIFVFNFRVGQSLLGLLGVDIQFADLDALGAILTASNGHTVSTILALGGGVFATLLVGCFIVGLIGATMAYFL